MYLSYVDESGDVGTFNSPSQYFVLSALIIHESQWLSFVDDLVEFRRYLKGKYRLMMNEEIHASEFIVGKPNLHHAIPRHLRLDLLKKCLNWIDSRPDTTVLTVCLNKKAGGDIFSTAWQELVQKFEASLAYKQLAGGFGRVEQGMVLADNTDGGKLTRLIRDLRHHNFSDQASYDGLFSQPRIQTAIEDPVFRDSRHSYIHQMVDVVAYFARQYYEPNRFIRRKGARTFYGLLSSVVNPALCPQENSFYSIVEV